jgi:DNA topoisomerase III
MDANGIGTDATMAEHIAKIKEREYVMTRPRSGRNAVDGVYNDIPDAPNARGGRGGRGGRSGRGGRGGNGAAAANGRSAVEEFIPTTLGVALVQGYDEIGLETSLSKPFLRKQMELSMKDICDGRKTRDDVVRDSLRQYKQVFDRTEERIGVLKAVSPPFCYSFSHAVPLACSLLLPLLICFLVLQEVCFKWGYGSRCSGLGRYPLPHAYPGLGSLTGG